MSETEIRCSECGHGATTTRLTAGPSNATESGSSPHQPFPAEVGAQQLEDLRRQHEAGPAAAFARATFLPYGLDDRWRGLRSFGGWGSSNDQVSRLVLAHLDDPWDPTSRHVSVQTRVPRRIGRGGPLQTIAAEGALCAQEQVGSLWRHTGQLPEQVRRAAFPLDGDLVDPTGPWADSELIIDGAAVTFRVLLIDDFWVGQAQHGDVLVAIESRGWPLDTTGLVTVDNLEPYETGSREIKARYPRPN